MSFIINNLYLIYKNLWRNKVRTVLLLIAVFVAFFIYSVLQSFSKAFNAGVELSASDRLIIVNKINFTEPLPYAYFNRIQAIPHIKAVTFASWFGGYYQEPKNMLVTLAVEPSSFLDVYTDMLVEPTHKARFIKEATCALVGLHLAQKYNFKIGDRIPINSAIFSKSDNSHTWDVDVCGIFYGKNKYTDTSALIMHHNYLNEARTFYQDKIGWLIVKTADSRYNDLVSKTIDDLFANSAYETRTTTEQAFNKAFLEQLGSISLIITSIISAAFITILMVVGNTMYLAIRERTREIAILKTLGFSAKHVFMLILAESLCVALLGGMLAIFTATLVIKIIGHKLSGMLPAFSMTFETAMLAIIWMLCLGILTGIVPAYNAMRLNIKTALGHH